MFTIAKVFVILLLTWVTLVTIVNCGLFTRKSDSDSVPEDGTIDLSKYEVGIVGKGGSDVLPPNNIYSLEAEELGTDPFGDPFGNSLDDKEKAEKIYYNSTE